MLNENEISYIVRGCIFKVYNTLGPGLLESAYKAVLAYELTKAGLQVLTEVPVPLVYEEIQLDQGYRMDILVDEKVLIELKSIEALAAVHHKQTLTYLKLANLRLRILVNFNTDDIASSIFRKVNKL